MKMTPSSLPLEIAYLIDERLALLGFYSPQDTPRYVSQRVSKDVHAHVSAQWPEQYREAVETGRAMA